MATKEEAKPALVPKLRFPEFRKAEGWKVAPLGELGAILTGKTPSTKEDDLWGGEILFITPTDITEDEKYQRTTQRTVVETTGTKVLPAGTVVYTCIASIGKMAITVFPSISNQQINAVVPNAKTAREFIYYSLANLTPWIKSIPATSTLPIINKTQFSGFIIPHPEDKAEQQKIAECLSSVDELMAAQARKVDALKTHKKGLMQQLFPREGETQPRLRFPEFRKARKWAVKTMGSIASFSSGGTPSKDNPEYWNGTIPWVSASSMYDLVVEKADHYVTPLAIGNGTRIAKKGSILILVRGSMLFKRVPICVAGIDVTFNQDVKALDVDASINTGFLLYQLSAFQSRIPINETGIGAGKIELDHLKGFELFIPDSSEQKRIATCLSSLDALITAEAQKHEALKTHKKGLMQQLFPAPEEVEA